VKLGIALALLFVAFSAYAADRKGQSKPAVTYATDPIDLMVTTLPPSYAGHDIAAVYRKMETLISQKDEYETTEQFDARIHAVLPQDPYAFKIELKIIRERREGYGTLRRFRSSAEVYESFREHFGLLDREEFVVLLLDAKNAFIGFNVVSVGSPTSSLVHPREVFKPVVLGNAAAVILLHNHPSGDPAPSQEDLHITRRIRDIGEVFGIRVLDHIIFGEGKYVSFVDDGYFEQCRTTNV
jgi:DNA repair protein RadC